MDRLKRMNDLACLEILRDFRDQEVRKLEPDESLIANIDRLTFLVTERHKAEDAARG